MRLSKFYFNTKKEGNFVKEKICESCNFKKLENKYICGVCKTIRNIRPSEYIKNKMNYFSMFDINDQYKIDKSKLDAQYKDLQKIVHPDKYAHEEEDILKEAQECSAYLSNGYQILKDDYKRANYLVSVERINL